MPSWRAGATHFCCVDPCWDGSSQILCLVLIGLICLLCCGMGRYFARNCKSSDCALKMIREVCLSLHQTGRKFTHANVVKSMQNWDKDSASPCQCSSEGCRGIAARPEKVCPGAVLAFLLRCGSVDQKHERSQRFLKGGNLLILLVSGVCSRGNTAQQENACMWLLLERRLPVPCTVKHTAA